MYAKRRPWPAFVDLFSALFIVALAGFALLSASAAKTEAELVRVRLENAEKSLLRAEVDKIKQLIARKLEQNQELSYDIRTDGDDIYFDLSIHFGTDSDRIEDDQELTAINEIITVLKEGLDSVDSEARREIEVVIEGHTDSRQISLGDQRQQYLYNWNLSSRRAGSLLYEFARRGVRPPNYSIHAVGLADSEPLCAENTRSCSARNRRTSILIRPDMAKIDKRLRAQTE